MWGRTATIITKTTKTTTENVQKYQYISSLLKMMFASDDRTTLEQLLKEEEQKIWERKQGRVTPGRMSRDEDAIQIVTNFEV